MSVSFTTAAAESSELRAAAERIDALLVTHGRHAEDLLQVVFDLYGAVLERVLELLDETDHLDDEILDAFVGDEFVSEILLLHGLHPDDLTARVADALDAVRPDLRALGADVELIDITASGMLRLRLVGALNEADPAVTRSFATALKSAVRRAAPEVTAVEVSRGRSDHQRR